MGFPIAAAIGGISAGLNLISGRGSRNRGGMNFDQPFYGRSDYLEASRRGTPRLFDFDFDEEDQELALARQGIERRRGDQYRRGIDEIGRAGMLGSGRAMSGLRGIDFEAGQANERAFSDIASRRRAEAMDLYSQQAAYDRALAMNQLNYLQGLESDRIRSLYGDMAYDRNAQRENLLGLGGFIGGALPEAIDYFGGPAPVSNRAGYIPELYGGAY